MTYPARRLLFTALRVGVVVCAVATAVAAPATASDAGALDADFGGDGRVVIDGPNAGASISSDTRGGLVVATSATAGSTVQLRRLAPDGEIDSTFGELGTVTLSDPEPSDCYITVCSRRLQVLHDGRILILTAGPKLRRLDATGRLDTGFGVNGEVHVPIRVASMIVAIDGTITLVGYRAGPDPNDYHDVEILLMRIDANGEPISGFGGDGTVETGVAGFPKASDWGPLGSIVVVGSDHGQAHAWRFASDGTPDPTFGSAGKLAISGKPTYFNSSGDHWDATSVVSQPDGDITFGGAVTFYSCTIKGNYDCTNSYEGWVSQDGSPAAPGPDWRRRFAGPSMAFGGQGGTFIFGSVIDSSDQFVIRRYRVEREIDLSYGVDGTTIPISGGGGRGPSGALVMPDGRQVVVTSSASAISVFKFLGDDAGVAAPYRQITEFGRTLLRKQGRLSVAGLASPSSARTEVALRRVESAKIRRRRGCLWYHPRSRTFRRSRAVGGRCERPRYFRVATGARWRFAVAKRLKPGRYMLHVRAVSSDGKRRTPFTYAADGYRSVHVRRR